MNIEYHSEIAVVLEFALSLPNKIKAQERLRLDIMTFLTLLPTLDLYPQRLRVKNGKS